MADRREYFETFIEAGDFLKKRHPNNAKLQGVDVESLGIQWHTAEPDALVVTEASPNRGDRAPFPYEPEEGFNPLKALGNLPYSGGKLIEDVAGAVTSPIETAEGLARGVAGGLESAFIPSAMHTVSESGEKIPFSISPKNVETFQAIKGGLKESVSPRGLQERPLDAASNVITGVGAAAKLGKVASRAGSALAKGQVPERLSGVQQAAQAGERIRDFTGRADPGQRLPGALDKAGDIFETVEKGAQRYDPANVLMRGGAMAGKKAAQMTADAATRAGVAAGRYAMGKVQESRPYKAGEEILERANSFIENTGIGEQLKQRYEQAEQLSPASAYTRINEAYNKAKQKGGDFTENVFGERPTPMGVVGGMMEEFLGFTFGLGKQAVRDLKNISMKGDDQTKLMLETIRNTDDAVVHRKIATDLKSAVKQYADEQSTLHKTMREPLQLNRVVADIVPLRDKLLQNLPADITVSPKTGAVKFGAFFTPTGRGAIENALQSILSYKNNAISLQQLDNFKGLIDDTLYESGLPPDSRAAAALREMRGTVRQYIGDIADDPVAMNAQLRLLHKKDQAGAMARDFPGMTEPPPGSIGEAIDAELLTAFADDAIIDMFGEHVAVGANEYSAAMRQYFNFQDNMDELRNNLKLERPQTREFVTDQIDPATGQPVKEQVLRQKASDIDMLRAVFKSFDDDTGIALETLRHLSEATNRPELISQVVGAMFRPTFGGGLVVRSEISQGVRDATRIAGGLSMNAMFGMITILPSLAAFSPKYGGQLFAAAMAPDGAKFINETFQKAKTYGNRKIDYVKLNAPEYYERAKRRVAEEKQKRAENVTDAEVLTDIQNMEKAATELEKIDATTLSKMRDFLRLGTAEQRTTQTGERRQQRQNLLQTLGRAIPGQTGITPPSE
jgi:hypothetical protein